MDKIIKKKKKEASPKILKVKYKILENKIVKIISPAKGDRRSHGHGQM